jgi:hypothetical protein
MMSERLYDTKAASRLLEERWGIKLSPFTLQKYRCLGGGPKFTDQIGGRVYYTEDSLASWVLSQSSNLKSNSGEEAA